MSFDTAKRLAERRDRHDLRTGARRVEQPATWRVGPVHGDERRPQRDDRAFRLNGFARTTLTTRTTPLYARRASVHGERRSHRDRFRGTHGHDHRAGHRNGGRASGDSVSVTAGGTGGNNSPRQVESLTSTLATAPSKRDQRDRAGRPDAHLSAGARLHDHRDRARRNRQHGHRLEGDRHRPSAAADRHRCRRGVDSGVDANRGDHSPCTATAPAQIVIGVASRCRMAR